MTFKTADQLKKALFAAITVIAFILLGYSLYIANFGEDAKIRNWHRLPESIKTEQIKRLQAGLELTENVIIPNAQAYLK